MIESIKNYTEQALEWVWDIFRGSDFWNGLLSIFTDELQEIEDGAHNMIVDRILVDDFGDFRVLTGITLDQYSKIVGNRPRGDLGDQSYQDFFETQVLVNSSFGGAEEVKDVVRRLTQPSKIIYRKYSPATHWMEIQSGNVSLMEPFEVQQYAQTASAAGVIVSGVVATQPNSFRLDSTTFGLDNGKLSSLV